MMVLSVLVQESDLIYKGAETMVDSLICSSTETIQIF